MEPVRRWVYSLNERECKLQLPDDKTTAAFRNRSNNLGRRLEPNRNVFQVFRFHHECYTLSTQDS